jgi:hypothetical protein
MAGRTIAGHRGADTPWAVRLPVLLFIIVCLFDPADRVLGSKVVVFLALAAVTLLRTVFSSETARIPVGLLIYLLTFTAIPLLSIAWYFASNGQQPFEGFDLLKGYLLIWLALLLVLNRVNPLPDLCAALTILAGLVIGVFTALQMDPALFDILYPLGADTGVMYLDYRQFSSDITILQVYIVTTPMLVLSIAWYFDHAMSATGFRQRLGYLSLTAINLVGMVLGGTRNNIVAAVLLSYLLWPLYHRKITSWLFWSSVALFLTAFLFMGHLQAFFSVEEQSNSIKFEMLGDYAKIFRDPVTLVFGQGLGAYQAWNAKGTVSYITELTYLELIRNFGMFGAAVMMGLLLWPVAAAFFGSKVISRLDVRRDRALAIAWFLYLLMCATNPNLFSSMGILILAALLSAKAYGTVGTFDHSITRTAVAWHAPRTAR